MNPPQEINFVPNLPVKMSEKQLQNGLCASLKRQLPTYRYILPITNTLIVKILAICDMPPGSYRIAQYGHPPYRFHPLVHSALRSPRSAPKSHSITFRSQVTQTIHTCDLAQSTHVYATSHVLAPNRVLCAARRQARGLELVRPVEVLVGGAHLERRCNA